MRENIAYSGILTLYCVMAAMEFVMILLIVPASTAGAVAGEREKQTLDILLSTKIRSFSSARFALTLSYKPDSGTASFFTPSFHD